ncbi:hypothetical protein GCM10027062_20620 [Nocardioides hungaricus]
MRRHPLPESASVPVPGETPDFRPYVWRAGKRIHRVGPDPRAENEPYVSPSPARFSPFPGGRKGRGRPVPTLYGAETALGAISETVFHDVPIRGEPRSVQYSKLKGRYLAELTPTRDLHLADLTSGGLRRLEVGRVELIESGPDRYLDTVGWAVAAYRHPRSFDGMVWMSRQEDTSRAVVLFGGRVTSRELEFEGAMARSYLTAPAAFEWILDVADSIGVAVAGAPFMP